MTPDEWKELEAGLKPHRERLRDLLERTKQEDEHPDDYNGPCFCKTCMSYADVSGCEI